MLLIGKAPVTYKKMMRGGIHMRKKMGFLLAAAVMTAGISVYAAEDYSQYSLEELKQMRSEISQEILQREQPEQEETESDNEASDFLYAVNDGEVSIRSYIGESSEVVIPDEIDGAIVTVIEDRAFYQNETVEKVVLPETIQSIGNEAFSGCQSLTDLTFPANRLESLTIGNEAFYHCDLTGSVIINAAQLTIGYRAFTLNRNITDIALLADRIVFGDSPFTYCKSVTTFYLYPSADISYQGAFRNSRTGDVFENMENLSEVYLPDNCSILSENTFANTPKAVVYARENSAVLQSAEALWIPTNFEDYDENSFQILERITQLGYEVQSEEIQTEATPAEAAITEETVRRVQERLNELGYPCGTVDGIVGNNTSGAIRQYQADQGMTQTGSIDAQLLEALGISS